MSLRAKFVVVLTLILTGGVGTTGIALIVQHQKHDETLLAEKQLLLVENAAFALQGNLSMAAREVSRISKLKEVDPGDDDLDPERQLLYGAHENSVLFKVVRILDAEGRVTTVQPASAEPANRSYADRHWFASARHAHQPFFYTVPEKAVIPDSIAVVVPVRHEGLFTGAVQAVIDFHDDTIILPELRHTAGPQGEFALVDHEGRVIFPSGAGDLAAKGFAFAFQALSAGRAGSRHVRSDAGDFMYAWAPVGIGSWGVAVRWPYDTLSVELRSQIETTIAILILGALVAGVLAVMFATYFTRPLLALGEVAARLARGQRGGVGRSSRRDEVGALFNAFDHMETELLARDQKIREDIETISRLNASLEERVAERTRELSEAQARLLDVERFAAMGKTAAAIAHELRNALNGLGMCVDLVLADTTKSGASQRVRAQIHYEIARLRDVTESLLTFSRTPRLERASTDVNGLVLHALEVLAEQIADGGVTVHTDLEGGPDTPLLLHLDGYKLQGAIINLVKNAIEAMTTRPLDLAGPPIEQKLGEHSLTLRTRKLEPDGAVSVEIVDTGPGLLPDARRHIFEPFYTTKVTGTGLGLATSRRVVEAHGGTVELGDREDGNEGTRALMLLPSTESDSMPSAVAGA